MTVNLYIPEKLAEMFLIVRDPIDWFTRNLSLNILISEFIAITVLSGPKLHTFRSSVCVSPECRVTESPSNTDTDCIASVSAPDKPAKQIEMVIQIEIQLQNHNTICEMQTGECLDQNLM